eukprot:scaffold92738_cov33-Phaeocystis_antarctica.AAC.1
MRPRTPSSLYTSFPYRLSTGIKETKISRALTLQQRPAAKRPNEVRTNHASLVHHQGTRTRVSRFNFFTSRLSPGCRLPGVAGSGCRVAGAVPGQCRVAGCCR